LETFEEVAPDDPRAIELFRAHTETGAEALGLPAPEVTSVASIAPPDGVLLLVSIDGEPVAIGGVRDLEGPAAEIKSMYVAPAARGRGIGRRILARLEEIAARRGCEATRLDTLEKLAPACALYESAGYVRIPDYNGSPTADRWYERRLVR
jgi:GNAT superfamily N-acetyltransferase